MDWRRTGACQWKGTAGEVPSLALSIVSQLVSGCFKPSQPQRIISGLKETFIKRYIVERTNKAEIRLEEQSEKAESYIQLKGP